jgi:hypothetical protein
VFHLITRKSPAFLPDGALFISYSHYALGGV